MKTSLLSEKFILLVALSWLSSNSWAAPITMDVEVNFDNGNGFVLLLDGETRSSLALNFEGTNSATGDAGYLYCVELLQPIGVGQYEFDSVPLSAADNRYHRAGWLMDTFSQYNDTPLSGALQLAIWEATHETDEQFDLYSGEFQVTQNSVNLVDFTDELEDITNTFLNNYDSSVNLDHLALYQSPTAQDLIGDNLHPVSEPGTLFMVMLGLAGLFKSRKTRSF